MTALIGATISLEAPACRTHRPLGTSSASPQHRLTIMDVMPANLKKPDHRTYTSMTTEGEAAVGRISIWAAWLEQHLVHLCVELINEDAAKVGAIVTANMSASSLIQLAKKLLAEYETIVPEVKVTTLAALNESKAALEERNKVIHATVGGSLVDGKTAFWSRRKIEAAHHSPVDLDEIGARLYKAMDDVWDSYLSISSARR